MAETKLHFGGLPTDPEIRTLYERYGVPEEGIIITYEELEEVLNCKRTTQRFQTVVSRWRRQLESQHNTLMVAVARVGYKAAVPEERVMFGMSQIRQSQRRERRAREVLAGTDSTRLDKNHAELLLYGMRVINARRQAALAEARRYKGPSALAPTLSLPWATIHNKQAATEPVAEEAP